MYMYVQSIISNIHMLAMSTRLVINILINLYIIIYLLV